jgi:hypothetical protein
MAAISDYLEVKLQQLTFNGVAFTAPATYIALFTAAPSDAGGGTEVSGGSYARVLVNPTGGASPTWDACTATGGLITNTHAITFAQATAAWGTVTHIGIFDALTVGNLLWHGALTASKVVEDGSTFSIPVGDLDCTLA